MNNTEGSDERSMKEKLIIEAAQKRFGLFGIEKTSMREIADDLKLSKASLYYYFPDKESLYKAVFEKEQAEFIALMYKRINSIRDADQLLREYSSSRLTYFRSLLNLSRIKLQAVSDLKPLFKDTMKAFREKEIGIIIRIIEKGKNDGVFHYPDPEAAAGIFLDLMKGLRMTMLSSKITLTPDQEEFETFSEKTRSVTEFFIRGLKYKG
jgi:AcrR family transcriptional regulator